MNTEDFQKQLEQCDQRKTIIQDQQRRLEEQQRFLKEQRHLIEGQKKLQEQRRRDNERQIHWMRTKSRRPHQY